MSLNHLEVFRVGCTDDWQRPFVVFEIVLLVHCCELLCIASSMSKSCAVDAPFVGCYWPMLTRFAAVDYFCGRGPCRGATVPIDIAFMFTLSWFC